MTKQQSDESLEHFNRKPSELPPYTPLHSYNKNRPVSHIPNHPQAQNSPLHKFLEPAVSAVRVEVESAVNAVSQQTGLLKDFYETGKAHTMQSIDYLNEPQNLLPRSGAIAMGGLAGLVFAARGGIFKKFFYTAIGAGAIASVCYPSQAEDVARQTLQETRKGIAITYNFINGVKPGDEVPFEPLKNFPTSVDDVRVMFWDCYDEVKENFFPGDK